MNPIPTEHELHAYVDDRLTAERRAQIDRYLAEHPERAAEIRAWQRDARQLRAALAGVPALAANPSLDPAAIRARRRRRTSARLAWAAVLVLSVGLGGAGGWQAHDWVIAHDTPPMADALAAYRLVTLDSHARLDISLRDDADLRTWVAHHFGPDVKLPDLRGAGFHPVGVRLLTTEQGPAALIVYKDDQARDISFYIRPPGPRRHMLPRGRRIDGDLLAQYGSDHRYNYAIVSQADGLAERAATQAFEQGI